MEQTISITVSGKVQGVFFRQSTKENALKLGITGEVRNTEDGKVFITATGSKDQLDKYIKCLKIQSTVYKKGNMV